jgi:hypothetical protein
MLDPQMADAYHDLALDLNRENNRFRSALQMIIDNYKHGDEGGKLVEIARKALNGP